MLVGLPVRMLSTVISSCGHPPPADCQRRLALAAGKTRAAVPIVEVAQLCRACRDLQHCGPAGARPCGNGQRSLHSPAQRRAGCRRAPPRPMQSPSTARAGLPPHGATPEPGPAARGHRPAPPPPPPAADAAPGRAGRPGGRWGTGGRRGGSSRTCGGGGARCGWLYRQSEWASASLFPSAREAGQHTCHRRSSCAQARAGPAGNAGRSPALRTIAAWSCRGGRVEPGPCTAGTARRELPSAGRRSGGRRGACPAAAAAPTGIGPAHARVCCRRVAGPGGL